MMTSLMKTSASNPPLTRMAFKMKLHQGQSGTYRQRHDALWPELRDLLKANGIEDYTIFLDEETHTLFSTFKIKDQSRLDTLPSNPVMKKWWTFMRDIMDTHPDHSPVSIPLQEVFYLP